MKIKLYLILSDIDDQHHVEPFLTEKARDSHRRALIQELSGSVVDDEDKERLAGPIETAWIEFGELVGSNAYYWTDEIEVEVSNPTLTATVSGGVLTGIFSDLPIEATVNVLDFDGDFREANEKKLAEIKKTATQIFP